jgi:hypothetical protein
MVANRTERQLTTWVRLSSTGNDAHWPAALADEEDATL